MIKQINKTITFNNQYPVMNPQCFVCLSQATRVCIHSSCSSPPFFCSGQCHEGLSARLHTHHGTLNNISYQDYHKSITDIKSTIDPQIFYKQKIDNLKKQALRVQGHLMREIKKMNQFISKLQQELYTALIVKLTQRPMEILQRINKDFHGKNLNGNEIGELLKNEEKFSHKIQILAAAECLEGNLKEELEKANQFKIDIVFMSYREMINKNYELFNEAKAFERSKQWVEALGKYKQAREVNNSDSEVHHKIGYCFQKLNQLDLAEQSYNMSLQLDPNYSDSLFNIGNIYFKRGNYEQSIRYYSETIEKDGEYVPAMINRGDSYVQLQMDEKALEDYLMVLKIHPRNQCCFEKVAQIKNKVKEDNS